MNNQQKAEYICQIFDALCAEILYGFNMRVVLRDMLEEGSTFPHFLDQFIRRCKDEREAISQRKETRS